jgi:hypothetical protein
LQNDGYFKKFNLSLPSRLPDQPNRFNGLNYATLGEEKTAFDLRTIRNVIIRQVSPPNDHSAMYEVFNRLNSGGVNLSPQEIRQSLFHSPFYDMLLRINGDPRWRKLLGRPDLDLHCKDVEILLRAFALMIAGDDYKSSMLRFLNAFSKKAQDFSAQGVQYFERLAGSFLDACSDLPEEIFLTKLGRFTVPVFGAVFASICEPALAANKLVEGKITEDSVSALKADVEFNEAASKSTTHKENVARRLERAKALVKVG